MFNQVLTIVCKKISENGRVLLANCWFEASVRPNIDSPIVGLQINGLTNYWAAD